MEIRDRILTSASRLGELKRSRQLTEEEIESVDATIQVLEEAARKLEKTPPLNNPTVVAAIVARIVWMVWQALRSGRGRGDDDI